MNINKYILWKSYSFYKRIKYYKKYKLNDFFTKSL